LKKRKKWEVIKEPSCVIEETKTWVPDLDEDFLEKLNEEYEITNNPEDYVESSEIIFYITNICKMKLSSQKIGLIISKLISISNSISVIKAKKVRLGIKRRLK
jgi:archaellum component FlaG (FlaF/FlaG flagellin family)